MNRSVCIRCGGDKELPLSRCADCGHVPSRGEAAISVLASSRMLADGELAEVQARIRRGEPLRPSRARLEAAGAVLRGEPARPDRQLDALEQAGLTLLTVALTPAPALAFAWTWRDAPAGRQALRIAAVGAVTEVALIVLFVRSAMGSG